MECVKCTLTSGTFYQSSKDQVPLYAHHKHCEGVVIDLIRAELSLVWLIVWLLVCARFLVDISTATGTGKLT